MRTTPDGDVPAWVVKTPSASAEAVRLFADAMIAIHPLTEVISPK